MKFKIYMLISVFVIATIGTYLTFEKLESGDKKNEELIIGTASGYAPWVSINEQGEYEGFDIDVIKEVAKKLNKKLVLKDLGSMSALFMALDQSKIDAIIWGMSITQDRVKRVAMVRYQGDTVKSFPLLFWKKIPDNIKTIDDMSGMTVCVEPASTQDMVLSKYNFINKIPTEKVDDALLNIQYGKANAALVEPAIAKKFKSKYPEIKTIDVILDPENQVQGVGICIKQNNVKLIKQLEEATDELIRNNVISKLEKKWNIT